MRFLSSSVIGILIVCILGMAWCPASAATAPYWPRFNGPNEDNISTDNPPLAKQWPKDGPSLVWTAKDLGEGFAGVTLAHGLVYTAGNIDGKMIITALDLKGQMRWQVENGPAYEKSYPGSRGTPTIDGDRLYHESPSGWVICLNAKTGKKIWQINILDKFNGEQTRWALAESVLIVGEHVICCPGGAETAVVALNKRNSQTVWQSPSANGELASYASPSVIEYKGLQIILTMTNESFIGVNAKNGKLLFQYSHPTRWKVNALMPVFKDGQILISSGYGTTGSVMLKLHVDGDKARVTKVWKSMDLDNQHGGVVVLDGYIYGAGHQSGKGKWVCLDWKTGETLWSAKGVGKGSLTCAEGLLFTWSENRSVGLVKATPKKCDLISKFKIPRGGKGKTWAHPVVCAGWLYLRHGNFLYVYDVAAR